MEKLHGKIPNCGVQWWFQFQHGPQQRTWDAFGSGARSSLVRGEWVCTAMDESARRLWDLNNEGGAVDAKPSADPHVSDARQWGALSKNMRFLSVCLSACLPGWLSVCLPVCLSYFLFSRRSRFHQIFGVETAEDCFYQNCNSKLYSPTPGFSFWFSKNGLKGAMLEKLNLYFPTSLCGVLVFDSVSRPASASASRAAASQLCLTPSYTQTHTHTHNFVTHHLSRTALSHTHTHIPSFTHVTHTHLWSPVVPRHLATSTFVSGGRSGTWRHSPSFCVVGVAGVALLAGLVARLVAVSPLVARDATALCVAGVAFGDIHLRLTWQVWHLAPFTFVFRGRRCTFRHLHSRCGAGVALMAPGWHAWSVARDAAALCVEGMALETSTFVSRGRRGTWRHTPLFGVALVALGWAWCWWRAWSPLVTPRHSAWQAWHLATSTSFHVAGVVLGEALLALGWVRWRAWSPLVARDTAALRVRRGTWRHPPSFDVAGVALGRIHLGFAWHAWHLWHWAQHFHTRLCHTQLLRMQHFHTPLFHRKLFHKPFFHTHTHTRTQFFHMYNFGTSNSYTPPLSFLPP